MGKLDNCLGQLMISCWQQAYSLILGLNECTNVQFFCARFAKFAAALALRYALVEK